MMQRATKFFACAYLLAYAEQKKRKESSRQKDPPLLFTALDISPPACRARPPKLLGFEIHGRWTGIRIPCQSKSEDFLNFSRAIFRAMALRILDREIQNNACGSTDFGRRRIFLTKSRSKSEPRASRINRLAINLLLSKRKLVD